MSGPRPEKAPQSEKSRAALAGRMVDSGIGIQDRNMAEGVRANRYKARGRSSARANASNAIAMKQNALSGRQSNRTKVAAKTITNIVGSSVDMATIRNKTGVSNTERLARGASHAVQYGADTLRTMGLSSQVSNTQQRLSVRNSNLRRQALLDGVAAGTAYGLEKKFDRDKKKKAKQKAFDIDMATGAQYDSNNYPDIIGSVGVANA